MRGPWVGVVLLLVTGCPNASTPSSGPIAFDDFPAEAARADCRLLFDCCTETEIEGVFTFGTPVMTEADCRTFFEMYFGSEHAALQTHMMAGEIGWNASAAGACVAAVDRASCADIARGIVVQPAALGGTTEPSCSARFVGLLAEGTACGGDVECMSGNCPLGSSSTQTCAPLPTEGMPCVDRCATGLGCDVRAAMPTCVTRRADGASCTPGFGDVCQSRNCNSDGTCGAPPPIMTCDGL